MTKLKPGNGGYKLEEGYRLEKVLGGLTFPSTIEFDPEGNLYIAEAGFTYPFIYASSKISRLEGDHTEVIAEGFNGPLIGMKWFGNGFLTTHRGTLSKVDLNGKKKDLVDDIPSYGDHHTNHIVIKGKKVYFGQGTITNSGVVGTDNLFEYGWLISHRDGHDIPPFDVTLTGLNFKSRNPFNPLEEIETGPFLPIGQKCKKGQLIKGQLKATGVIYQCNLDGSDLEVYASGFRNPFALSLDPKGGILTIVQGEDHRGSRPVHAPDALYEVKHNAWYGWPDFCAGKPVSEYMKEKDNDNPKGFIMENHSEVEQPLHTFEEHSAAVSLDFSTASGFGFKDEAFVAQFGSGFPVTTGGKMISVGYKIVRLDMETMKEEDFFVNVKKLPVEEGPNRPVQAKFSPDGKMLYILDHGIRGFPKTGALWKIVKG